MKGRVVVLFLIASLLGWWQAPAQEAEIAAYVQSAEGGGTVVGRNEIRNLAGDIPIWTGDLLLVPLDGKVQIMFADGMVVVLSGNSALLVEDFSHSWGSNESSDFHCRLSLGWGMMRLWPARVAAKNSDNGLLVRTSGGEALVDGKMIGGVMVEGGPPAGLEGFEALQKALESGSGPVTWAYLTGFAKYPLTITGRDGQKSSIVPGRKAVWSGASGVWTDGVADLALKRDLKMADKDSRAKVPASYEKNLGKTSYGGGESSGGSSGGG
ncbi:MAG: hypothetical protein EOM25_03930 [Deltaproteobacteria bacterium]|nr:hypothetical protein [Deltaproteobacteria bacterium]